MTTEAATKPRRRVRIGWIIIGVILALVIAAVIWLFIPDFPPRPWEPVLHKIGTLFAKNPPLPSLTTAQWQEVENKAIADGLIVAHTTDPLEAKANTIFTQLKAANIPLDSVSVLQTKSGQQVLTLSMDFDDMVDRIGATNSISQTLDSFRVIANDKAIDLSGMQDIDIALHDSQGRSLLNLSAPAASLQQFREGKITQRELAKTIGARGGSRIGILEAARKAGLSQ